MKTSFFLSFLPLLAAANPQFSELFGGKSCRSACEGAIVSCGGKTLVLSLNLRKDISNFGQV